MLGILNEQTKIILLLLLIFFSLVAFGWFIIFIVWVCFTFIFKGNSKNRTGREYLESILKYEKISVQTNVKLITTKYLNVKKNNIINVKKRDLEKSNIWNIYNIIAYIQIWKWKHSHKRVLFYLILSNILFVISLIAALLIGLFFIINAQDLLTNNEFDLMVTICAYFSLVTLLLSWFISAFGYEKVARDIHLLASEYLNDQDLAKFKTITILRTIFVGSELLGRISL